MSDDQVIDAVLAELDKSKTTLRLATVVCLQADPLLVSIDGVGSVPALQQGITMAEGDVAWALWAPPRKPIVIAGADGGAGAQGLFGSGVDQSGSNANAGGDSTSATDVNAFAVGYFTSATAFAAFAEGNRTQATGTDSHAEGVLSTASGTGAHAEGHSSGASGDYAHAEGDSTTASGDLSHAEGDTTQATNDSSHSEGHYTVAGGVSSHAEGIDSQANGYASHAQGWAAVTFRTAEDATAMRNPNLGEKTLQHSQVCIADDRGQPDDVNIGSGTDPIIIPVHDGHFDAKLTIYSDDMADRWDITFRGNNDATDFAGRGSGTVTIAASAGGSATAYGTSTITWAVTGSSTGDIYITPSDSTGIRYAHVDLFELHANIA